MIIYLYTTEVEMMRGMGMEVQLYTQRVLFYLKA